MMNIFLDLNFTLVANSQDKIKPFIQQVMAERYRIDLVEWLVDGKAQGKIDEVVMITARPVKYNDVTLLSIKQKTRWSPDRSFFNEANERPHLAKKHILDTYFQDMLPEEWLAIESNPLTRKMYKERNIKAFPWEEVPHLDIFQ